jgi:hypothetical protein
MWFLVFWAWLTSLKLSSPRPSIYWQITTFHSSFSLNKIHGVFLCSSVLFSFHNYEFVLCLKLDILDIGNVVLSFCTFHHEFWNFIYFMSFWIANTEIKFLKYPGECQNTSVLCWDLDLNILTNKGTIIFYFLHLHWI